MLKFYKPDGPHGHFSNFYPCNIQIDNRWYRSSEHYYQSMKYIGPNSKPIDLEYSDIIIKQKTPNKARILANMTKSNQYQWNLELNKIIEEYKEKGAKIRDDFDSVKDGIMRKVVFQKFNQIKELKKLLMETGDVELIEHTDRDNYWADGGDGSGANRLGQILMEVRRLFSKKEEYNNIEDGYRLINNLCVVCYRPQTKEYYPEYDHDNPAYTEDPNIAYNMITNNKYCVIYHTIATKVLVLVYGMTEGEAGQILARLSGDSLWEQEIDKKYGAIY